MADSYWRSVHELGRQRRPALHMPGHGNRAAGWLGDGGALSEELLALDQSEIGGLDYLHEPVGPLLRALERAAAVFGADRSWFLVNGATVGNLAAVFALAKTSGTVIAMRRSHQSLHAAVTMAGLSVRYLAPVHDPELDGLFALDLDELSTMLATTPDVVAVHVTSPDYYGFGLPLRDIADICHAAGVPLVVDEAHGGHLTFIDGAVTGLNSGADLVVHSPHKSLGSLTQSAMLHLQGDLVDPTRIAEALMMLQSSSPSALLTMSLDAVVEELWADGAGIWNQQARLATAARNERLGGDPMFVSPTRLPSGVAWVDPCKLIVAQPSWRGATAEVRAQLETRHHLRPEFADHCNLVFSVTRNTTHADLQQLCEALREVVVPCRDAAEWSLALWPAAYGDGVHEPRAAAVSPRCVVPLRDAVGHVAARALTPYPPGIPLVLPGERITSDTLHAVQRLIAHGVTVRGLQSGPDDCEVVVVR